MQEGKSSSEAQANFLRNTKDRVFLFDKKVHQLDEVWEKSIRLETYQEIFNNLVGPERTKYVEAAGKVKLELPELVTRAQELFGRDLRMS
jgi:hypothetical protein